MVGQRKREWGEVGGLLAIRVVSRRSNRHRFFQDVICFFSPKPTIQNVYPQVVVEKHYFSAFRRSKNAANSSIQPVYGWTSASSVNSAYHVPHNDDNVPTFPERGLKDLRVFFRILIVLWYAGAKINVQYERCSCFPVNFSFLFNSEDDQNVCVYFYFFRVLLLLRGFTTKRYSVFIIIFFFIIIVWRERVDITRTLRNNEYS